jgi:hypothetical protein
VSAVFDMISRRGHALAEKRARAADPQFAADQDARRAKPGVVLGSEGPGGLDGFFAEMETARKHDPWWLTATLHIHWWMQKHGPSATWANVKAFWQRGRRGWADRDVWNLDHYLSTVIRDSVNHLNETKHGWPGDPMTYEEWGQILTEISEGMQAHLDVVDILKTEPDEHPALDAKRDLAFQHLTKYWGHLWD